MEMPAQAGLHADAFAHKVLPMVDQQLQLSGGAVELGHRKVGLPQRGPGHGRRVDGIGLALVAAATALPGHEPRRHSHHRLSGGEQVRLQAPVKCRRSSKVHRRWATARPTRFQTGLASV
jgi:hypothetical protein